MAMGSKGGYLPLSGGTLTGGIAGPGSAAQVTNFGGYQVTNSGSFYWTNRALIQSPADGIVALLNNAGTDFTRLQFGGTTSSFPALKRNAAALETKLADDSAYAQHNQLIAALVDGITAPSATAGLAKIFVDTADGDLKVIFGDGTTKVISADT